MSNSKLQNSTDTPHSIPTPDLCVSVVPPQVDGYGLAGGPVLRLGVQPRLVRLQMVDMVWCGNMVLYMIWVVSYGMGARLRRLLSVHMV